MAVLQQRSGPPPLLVYPLNEEVTQIGRQPECEVFLDSRDVSRHHARILQERGRFLIEDLQSRNGTRVNGQPLDGTHALEDGDEITIASLEFAFLTEDPLLHDSSSSAYAPTVITLSSGTSSGSAKDAPLVVSPGDRIPAEAVGLCDLDSSAVVSRVPVGQSDGGWPTFRQSEDKLTQVLQLQHQLRGAVQEDEVLTRAIEGLFDAFALAERIAVILRSSDGDGFVVAAASSRSAGDAIRISIPLLYGVMQSGESVLHVEREAGVTTDSASPRALSVRYLLGATLIDSDRAAAGAIQVETRRTGGFEPVDAERLAILSHVISCRLDDCAAAGALTQTALQHRSRRTAEHLHRQLMPVRLPCIDGFQIRHQVRTVPDIAADLVDYVPLPDGRLGCYILDVPGRGPRAVGLMAAIRPLITRALAVSASPAAAIRMVEEELATRMSEIPLVTSLCTAILDPRRSTVTLSIAGQCPVFHFRADAVELVAADDPGGPPLGTPRDICLEREFRLAEDDVLLLCSDGIARIPVADGLLAASQEMRGLLERADSAERSELQDRVMQEILAQVGGSQLPDDVALLAIHKSDAARLSCDAAPVCDTQVQR